MPGSEDRDAVAAAVQNLLLAATSFGLGNFWATIPEVLEDAARHFAGSTGTTTSSPWCTWVGPTGTAPAPERPPAEVTWLS